MHSKGWRHPALFGLTVVTVGRKGRDAMRRARVPIEAHFEGFGDRPQFADVPDDLEYVWPVRKDT